MKPLISYHLSKVATIALQERCPILSSFTVGIPLYRVTLLYMNLFLMSALFYYMLYFGRSGYVAKPLYKLVFNNLMCLLYLHYMVFTLLHYYGTEHSLAQDFCKIVVAIKTKQDTPSSRALAFQMSTSLRLFFILEVIFIYYFLYLYVLILYCK